MRRAHQVASASGCRVAAACGPPDYARRRRRGRFRGGFVTRPIANLGGGVVRLGDRCRGGATAEMGPLPHLHLRTTSTSYSCLPTAGTEQPLGQRRQRPTGIPAAGNPDAYVMPDGASHLVYRGR
jgi:hypothetical protein